MELPAATLASALLQFNLGLELGQVSIVAAVAAVLFLLRQQRAYVPWVLRGGSVTALGLAAVWFVERAADVSLLPI